MTIPRANRITRREFTKLVRTGRRFRGRLCSLQIGPLPGTRSKIAVVVPVRVEHSAVARNRVRRVVSQALASLIPRLKIPSFIIAFIHSATPDGTREDCIGELQGLVEKSGIIRP